MSLFSKIFTKIFIALFVVASFFAYINYNMIKNSLLADFNNNLEQQWQILNTLDLQHIGSAELDNLLTNISKQTDIRVTIISPDGVVLNDTDVDYNNIPNMQNHKEREEVRNALFGKPSMSSRVSATTNIATYYYAALSSDGNVLRVAYNSDTIAQSLTTFKSSFLALFVASLVLFAIVAVYFARMYAMPISALNELSLQILSDNDEQISFKDFNDEHIDNISNAIYKVHRNIAVQEKDIIIERQKLEMIFSAMKEGIMLISSQGNVIHINDNAKKHINNGIAKNTNVLSDISDIDTIMFFKNLLKKNDDDKRRITYKERIYDLYSKTIGDNTLVVFDEVTESAQYEAFKTELVGNITHEIKTPLALMLGASETIINDPDMDTETRNKFLTSIFRNSKELNNLINETFELHRLEAQRGAITVEEPTNLQSVMKDIEIMIGDKSGKQLTYEVPDNDVMIRSEHILSIVTNLVNNAIKYSKGDNIAVVIENVSNKVIISVADEGPAIPEIEQKRIFERFYTVSKARTRGRSGSGIGLAIVKHISKQYAGEASVHTNKKSGNTFVVELHEKR